MTRSPQIKKWEKISSSVVLPEPWFQVRKETVKLASGTIIDDYFVWDSPSVVTIVPFTSDGKFVLCKQYRYAVDKIMYQFPAGAVNKGELPEKAAHRELQEETGYISSNLEFLGNSASYPTKLSGWHHLYFAKNVKPIGTKQNDESEPIQVILKTPKELEAMILNNEFQVTDSLATGLLALKLLGY